MLILLLLLMIFSLTTVDVFVSDVYSFEEEEAVLDPLISEHLSHFGIDMLQMQSRVSCSCPKHTNGNSHCQHVEFNVKVLSVALDGERSPHRQQQPAARQRVGGDPGVGHETESSVWFRLHGHQKPWKHLLPRHSDAGALQHPRLPENVSYTVKRRETKDFV